MKIMIIGSGGSGKSTFARQVGPLLELPVYHLDAYYWKPGWVATPEAEWDAVQRQLIEHPEWIIDGNYGRTLGLRMQAADVIIFFDLSPWLTTYRVIKRRIQYHGKSRPDLNEGCPESLDWEFIKWVWTFRKSRSARIMDKLRKYQEGRTIMIFSKPRQVLEFLALAKQLGRKVFDLDQKGWLPTDLTW